MGKHLDYHGSDIFSLLLVANYRFADPPFYLQVTHFLYMFSDARMFTGIGDVGAALGEGIEVWDTSNAVTMDNMFSLAAAFNAPIQRWDVEKVTSFKETFSKAIKFDQPIGQWNIISVISGEMKNVLDNKDSGLSSCNKRLIADAWASNAVFRATETIVPGDANALYITAWGPETCPPLTDAKFMRATWDVVNLDARVASAKWGILGNWDVSGVKDFSRAFSTTRDIGGSYSGGAAQNPKAKSFTFVGLEKWATTSVTTLYKTFNNAKAMNADLAKWDVAKVTSLRDTFLGALQFTGSGVDSWNTKSVTSLKRAFHGASSMNAGLEKWDVSKVTDLDETFNGASAFQGDGLAHWDTTSVSTFAPSFTTTFELNSGITACNKRKIADVWSTESTSTDE